MSSRERRGFTLLEVMVALAILAMSLVVLSDVVGGALRNHVRARQLDVATLLARGKMAALEDELAAKGFRDFDQTEEGTFEDDGHPEVRWKVEVVKPTVDLGPEAVLDVFAGQKASGLFPPADDPNAQAKLAALKPLLDTILTRVGEELKRGAREVRLEVSWADGKVEESFTVVTHLFVPPGGP